MAEDWRGLAAELDRADDERRSVEIWLRDDDAVDETPALRRLSDVALGSGLPVLLAVIPARATAALGAFISNHPGLTPCQHGHAHTNHAPAGARACELGHRPLGLIESELTAGRSRLHELFGDRLSHCLVPPWNRIDAALVPRLPALGFDRLSTFGPPDPGPQTIPRLNADLDIIDWRAGRVGRTFDDVAGRLAKLISAPRGGRPIGLLTHHLAHDATAWAVMEDVLTRLAAHPAVRFVDGATCAAVG